MLQSVSDQLFEIKAKNELLEKNMDVMFNLLKTMNATSTNCVDCAQRASQQPTFQMETNFQPLDSDDALKEFEQKLTDTQFVAEMVRILLTKTNKY